MLLVRAGLFVTLLAALATTAVYATPVHHAPTGRHSNSRLLHKQKSPKKSKIKGQRQIDSDRAREIQQALIHENYLSGEPTGQWDDQTQQAMKRFQGDHGWQTKIMPDSRALIKLGLGPANPDTSGVVTGAATSGGQAQSASGLAEDPNTLAAARSTGR